MRQVKALSLIPSPRRPASASLMHFPVYFVLAHNFCNGILLFVVACDGSIDTFNDCVAYWLRTRLYHCFVTQSVLKGILEEERLNCNTVIGLNWIVEELFIKSDVIPRSSTERCAVSIDSKPRSKEPLIRATFHVTKLTERAHDSDDTADPRAKLGQCGLVPGNVRVSQTANGHRARSTL
jgi:hypothetical protein